MIIIWSKCSKRRNILFVNFSPLWHVNICFNKAAPSTAAAVLQRGMRVLAVPGFLHCNRLLFCECFPLRCRFAQKVQKPLNILVRPIGISSIYIQKVFSSVENLKENSIGSEKAEISRLKPFSNIFCLSREIISASADPIEFGFDQFFIYAFLIIGI